MWIQFCLRARNKAGLGSVTMNRQRVPRIQTMNPKLFLMLAWLLLGIRCSITEEELIPALAFLRSRYIDAVLQTHAYAAFLRPRTGVAYDGAVPSELAGVAIAAMRLRSGSLKNRGVSKYKEFTIPTGVVVKPYVERLVMVYQNLGNWSSALYPPPSGHLYLAPVLGLLAYSASNLSAAGLPELNLTATEDSISVDFQSLITGGDKARCVFYDLDGVRSMGESIGGRRATCYGRRQGHFSIVGVERREGYAPAAAPEGGGVHRGGGGRGKWVILGTVAGGLVVMCFVGISFFWVRKYRERVAMQEMERASETGEAVLMTRVGNTRAPAAPLTRTRPLLEHNLLP